DGNWWIRARVQFSTTLADRVEIGISHTGQHVTFIHKKRIQRHEVEYLARADQALKDAKAISESDRQDEHALLVRERAEAAGRRGLFAEADEAVAQLEATASDSPSSA